MTRLKQVLAKESERSNLRNVGICLVAVLVLVIAAFVVAYTDFRTPTALDGSDGGTVNPAEQK